MSDSKGVALRFSIGHLLLLFPAWVIAFLIAPYAKVQAVRVNYRHDNAASDIRGIRLWAALQLDQRPNLQYSDYDAKQLWTDLGHQNDPWGNKYQLIERDEPGLYDLQSPFHAYSFGADGKSDSNGNDPDDINSWNYDRYRYYGAKIAMDERVTNLMKTLWLTPLVYLTLLVVCYIFKPGPYPNHQSNSD